ncbi:MAG: ABC transporter permease [Oligoflexia bacterium]|nr:ABC transporter permease [Oligoflexia bacterium]
MSSKLKNIFFVLVSILIGFVIAGVILKLGGFDPFEAYKIMFLGIFSKLSYVSYTIIKSTPIILTGLSVAFAFKTGLFNIGAEGQFIIGATATAYAGYFLNLPSYIQIPTILLIGVVAAGLWGGVAGFLKSRFGIHEVISTIMLNWIALYLQNYIVMLPGFRKPESEASFDINASGSITILENWKYSDAGVAFLDLHPLIGDFLRPPFNAGIFIAFLAALIIYYILNKTTMGYQLRAVGFNKHAAEYGGINVRKNMITAMFISGGLAGLAGSLHVMGVSKNIAILAATEGYGFDGIAVALIGGNSPLGCVLSGFLFGGLKYSGAKIQSAMEAPSEIISIMIGIIVFFMAIPKLFKILSELKLKKLSKLSKLQK